MPDLIYRFDPTSRHRADVPPDPATALRWLEEGNREFSRLIEAATADGTPTPPRVIRFDADDLGIPETDGTAPVQLPFAAVLGCSDARVPTEMILGQACNDLFVVRVAGNVLGAECLGSLDYALSNLGAALRLVVVLGHSGCGAVTAAADTFIEPSRYLQIGSSHPLRAVVDKIFPTVRAAHWGLEEVYGQQVEANPGYRRALIETSVALNAAMTAATVRHEFADRLGDKIDVVYGVYNLVTRRVKLTLEPDDGVAIRLAKPPAAGEGFEKLAVLVAGSSMVRALLGIRESVS